MLTFSRHWVIVLLLFGATHGIEDPTIPAGLFYPFGLDEGDGVVPAGMSGFSEIQLARALAFRTEFYRKIIVETHGLITFGYRYSDYTPQPFPLIGDRRAFLAPYWASADTSLNSGNVFFRYTNNSVLLKRAQDDVQFELGVSDELGSFIPRHLVIVTWYKVTFSRYGSSTTPVNKFQAILTWNDRATAVMYRYADLKWTTGGFSGGDMNGLFGTPAEMGYNSGSDDFFFKHAWSLTNNIMHLGNNTNVGAIGHFAFRVDALADSMLGCDSDDESACQKPFQRPDGSGECVDYFPSFGCPTMEGPVVVPENRYHTRFEFYCDVVDLNVGPDARYEINFLFGGEPDCTVPDACHSDLTVGQRVSLSSEQLRGKRKMGTTLSCGIRSYWSTFPGEKSGYYRSNEYFMGILFPENSREILLSEDGTTAEKIVLKSTVPITCERRSDLSSTEPCSLALSYEEVPVGGTTSIMAFRQRYKNEDPIENGCKYIIREGDWDDSEKVAYEAPLEVLARLDPYVTDDRRSSLIFKFVTTDDPSESVWNGYVSPALQLIHRDVATPYFKCSVAGDPRIITYDKLYYSTHCNGKFDYSRSPPGSLGFEIQARHCPCHRSALDHTSCVCGIAIREDDMILVAETCNNPRLIQFRGTNDDKCYRDNTMSCGMYVNGQRFKLVMPSGNRVYGTSYASPGYSYPRVDVEVVVTTRSRNVNGLCGSPDGNSRNDWSYSDGTTISIPPTSDPWPPKDLVDSWGHPANQTLFESLPIINPSLPNLDKLDERQVKTFCQCTASGGTLCGGVAVTDTVWPNDPDISVQTAFPSEPTKDADCRTWFESSYCGANYLKSTHALPIRRGRLTEEEANATCWNKIMNEKSIGSSCLAIMMNDTVTALGHVSQCVLDVLATDDYAWADDRVKDVQRECFYDVIMRNNSEVNDTSEAIDMILAELQEVTDYMCTPYDCNGHGECLNGTCLCTEGYIGSDCAVSRSAVPVIIELLSNGIINIRNDSSTGVSLYVSDTADVPTMSCKFDTWMLNGIQTTYIIPGAVTSQATVVCALPNEALMYNSKYLEFARHHEPGFDFSCLTAGSPAIYFSLSISNDGKAYSSSVDVELRDTLCVDCSSGTCIRLPRSCYINGYCFADEEPNPYMDGCEVCDADLSDNSWTVRRSDESCPKVWACPDNQKCIPSRNFTYSCVLEACESSPCLNGGTCVDSGTSFNCSCLPSYTGTFCESTLSTTTTTAATTTTTTPTTTSTPDSTTTTTASTTTTTTAAPSTTNFFADCGNIMHNAENAELPGGWHLGCYITLGDEDHWKTPCSELLDGLSNYGSSDALLAAGGNFGCWMTIGAESDEVYNACIDNYQHHIYMDMCRNCNFLAACIRFPTHSSNALNSTSIIEK